MTEEKKTYIVNQILVYPNTDDGNLNRRYHKGDKILLTEAEYKELKSKLEKSEDGK